MPVKRRLQFCNSNSTKREAERERERSARWSSLLLLQRCHCAVAALLPSISLSHSLSDFLPRFVLIHDSRAFRRSSIFGCEFCRRHFASCRDVTARNAELRSQRSVELPTPPPEWPLPGMIDSIHVLHVPRSIVCSPRPLFLPAEICST